MKGRLSIFLLALILALVYWQWFLPGPRVATDFSSISDSLLKSLVGFPWVWMEKPSEGLGEYTIFTLWSYPFNFLSGVLANLGLGFVIQERIIFLIPFLLIGVWSFWKLCGRLIVSSYAKLISTLFYLVNTYILLLIDGGQFNVALAYSFFPISFLAVEQSVKGGLRSRILAGLAASILGFFDIRFIYVLFLLSSLRFLYQLLFLTFQEWPVDFLRWIKSALVIATVMIGLNAYWLWPYIKVPLSEAAYASLTKASFVSFTNLGHGILLLQPHWYKNIFGNITPLRWEFILIPILVFLAPILKRRNREVGFWMLVALISIFLVKGASEPLGKVYPWLFHNLPGFSLFRDPSKFFFLVALSYSVLMAVSLDVIIKRLAHSPKIKSSFISLVIFYLIFLVRPVWLGQMTGTFSQPPFEKEYSQLAQILAQDQKFSRVFWIPTISPLSHLTLEHPSVEASRLVQRRPFAIGTKGAYETFNFLREAPFMGEIFDVSGIGYVVYPYLDERRDNLHPDNIKYYYTFSNQLSNLPWLSKLEESRVPIWKVREHQNRFFMTPNVWWVVGSDSLYSEATKNAKLKLSENALIFMEEHPGLGNAIDKFPEAKIVLNNKTTTDLAATFIDPPNLFFPAKDLTSKPDNLGWWMSDGRDLIKWRDFLQNKYKIDNQDFDLGGDWAVAENSLYQDFKVKKSKKGDVLLARLLISLKGGKVDFYQKDRKVGSVITKDIEGKTYLKLTGLGKISDQIFEYNKGNVRWVEVGQLPMDEEVLTIKTEGDINVINALALVDKNEWSSHINKVQSFFYQGRITAFQSLKIPENSVKIHNRQINPTKFVVQISNLSKPIMLVFSESYHQGWQIEGKKALPIYSLLNGFRIEKDGTYEVRFIPQRWVYPGLIISGASLFALIVVLIMPKVRSKS